jgi:ketosteroid isomerase-like protein
LGSVTAVTFNRFEKNENSAVEQVAVGSAKGGSPMKGPSISWVLSLVVAAMIMVGCRASQTPPPAAADTREQDEMAIRGTAEDWGRAIEAKNVDETLSFYADDAWVYPQNAPIAKTADERRAVWAQFFGMPGAENMEGDIARLEVARSGDLAVQFGTFAMTMNDKSGKPVTENEKNVVTWKKQADGKWKVIADIWNTDK